MPQTNWEQMIDLTQKIEGFAHETSTAFYDTKDLLAKFASLKENFAKAEELVPDGALEELKEKFDSALSTVTENNDRKIEASELPSGDKSNYAAAVEDYYRRQLDDLDKAVRSVPPTLSVTEVQIKLSELYINIEADLLNIQSNDFRCKQATNFLLQKQSSLYSFYKPLLPEVDQKSFDNKLEQLQAIREQARILMLLGSKKLDDATYNKIKQEMPTTAVKELESLEKLYKEHKEYLSENAEVFKDAKSLYDACTAELDNINQGKTTEVTDDALTKLTQQMNDLHSSETFPDFIESTQNIIASESSFNANEVAKHLLSSDTKMLASSTGVTVKDFSLLPVHERELNKKLKSEFKTMDFARHVTVANSMVREVEINKVKNFIKENLSNKNLAAEVLKLPLDESSIIEALNSAVSEAPVIKSNAGKNIANLMKELATPLSKKLDNLQQETDMNNSLSEESKKRAEIITTDLQKLQQTSEKLFQNKDAKFIQPKILDTAIQQASRLTQTPVPTAPTPLSTVPKPAAPRRSSFVAAFWRSRGESVLSSNKRLSSTSSQPGHTLAQSMPDAPTTPNSPPSASQQIKNALKSSYNQQLSDLKRAQTQTPETPRPLSTSLGKK